MSVNSFLKSIGHVESTHRTKDKQNFQKSWDDYISFELEMLPMLLEARQLFFPITRSKGEALEGN